MSKKNSGKSGHLGDETMLSFYVENGKLTDSRELAETIGRTLTDEELEKIVVAGTDCNIVGAVSKENCVHDAALLIKKKITKVNCMKKIIIYYLKKNRRSDAVEMAKILNEL